MHRPVHLCRHARPTYMVNAYRPGAFTLRRLKTTRLPKRLAPADLRARPGRAPSSALCVQPAETNDADEARGEAAAIAQVHKLASSHNSSLANIVLSNAVASFQRRQSPRSHCSSRRFGVGKIASQGFAKRMQTKTRGRLREAWYRNSTCASIAQSQELPTVPRAEIYSDRPIRSFSPPRRYERLGSSRVCAS